MAVRSLIAALVVGLLGVTAAANQAAAAGPAAAPVYLADGGGAVSLAVVGGKPLLAAAQDPASQWTYDQATSLYKNVASGQCLAALSPVDGLTVKMAACDPKDRYQQWKRGAGQPGLVVITSVATDRCLTAEGTSVGSRLYQEVCTLTGVENYWAAGERTLAIVGGNGQRLVTSDPGVPFAVKVIGVDGQAANGVKVSFYVRSARATNHLIFDGAAETAIATTGADGVATSPKLKLSGPGEFEIRFTGSASLDDGNSIAFEGTCLC
jgi:hypothetical protein